MWVKKIAPHCKGQCTVFIYHLQLEIGFCFWSRTDDDLRQPVRHFGIVLVDYDFKNNFTLILFSMILSPLTSWGKKMSMHKGGYLCGSHVSHKLYTPASCQLFASEHAPLPTTNNPYLLGKCLVPGKGPQHLLSFGPINDTKTYMSSFALRNEGMRHRESWAHQDCKH